VPTSYSIEAGRRGGLMWELAVRLPTVGDRALAFIPATMAGAVVLLVLWRSAQQAGHGREAGLLLLGMLSWLAAQSLNAQAWQRYCEPILLLSLAWLASMSGHTRRAWIGPALLGAIL